MFSAPTANGPPSPASLGLRLGPGGTLFLQDSPLLLPPKETGVLKLLLMEWPRVVGKERFSNQVWSGGMSDAGLARSITQLRHALAAVPGLTIRSAYGQGYQLLLDARAATAPAASKAPQYARLAEAAMAPPGMAESLMHARQLIQIRTLSTFQRAQRLLLELIDRAPQYMAAKVAYAECISAMVSSGCQLHKPAICEALGLLDHVEQQAPDTAGLYAQQAHLLDCVWEFGAARARHQLTLSRAPDDSASHHHFGWHLLATGEPQKAVQAFTQARTLAPFFLPSTIMLARACMMTGDLTQTLKWAELANAEHPEASHAQIYLMTLRAYLQPSAELATQARGIALNDQSWSFASASVAYVLARCGTREEALQVVDQWSVSPSSNLNASHATPLLVLGEIERAMQLMEKAAEQEFGILPILMRVWENAEMANHPRFAPLLRRVSARL